MDAIFVAVAVSIGLMRCSINVKLGLTQLLFLLALGRMAISVAFITWNINEDTGYTVTVPLLIYYLSVVINHMTD